MSKICKLIEAENPIMKVRLSGCSPDLDRDDVEEKLLDSMKNYNGIGLSANQIGEPFLSRATENLCVSISIIVIFLLMYLPKKLGLQT